MFKYIHRRILRNAHKNPYKVETNRHLFYSLKKETKNVCLRLPTTGVVKWFPDTRRHLRWHPFPLVANNQPKSGTQEEEERKKQNYDFHINNTF